MENKFLVKFKYQNNILPNNENSNLKNNQKKNARIISLQKNPKSHIFNNCETLLDDTNY